VSVEAGGMAKLEKGLGRFCQLSSGRRWSKNLGDETSLVGERNDGWGAENKLETVIAGFLIFQCGDMAE